MLAALVAQRQADRFHTRMSGRRRGATGPILQWGRRWPCNADKRGAAMSTCLSRLAHAAGAAVLSAPAPRAPIKRHPSTRTHSLQGRKPGCLGPIRGQGGTVEQGGTEGCSSTNPLKQQANFMTGTVERQCGRTHMLARARMRNNHVPLFQCSRGANIHKEQGLDRKKAGTRPLFHCSSNLKRGG